jgi:hypothetical protein
MEHVEIEQLGLLDLQGKSVALRAYFRDYLLLIFLRHLA